MNSAIISALVAIVCVVVFLILAALYVINIRRQGVSNFGIQKEESQKKIDDFGKLLKKIQNEIKNEIKNDDNVIPDLLYKLGTFARNSLKKGGNRTTVNPCEYNPLSKKILKGEKLNAEEIDNTMYLFGKINKELLKPFCNYLERKYKINYFPEKKFDAKKFTKEILKQKSLKRVFAYVVFVYRCIIKITHINLMNGEHCINVIVQNASFQTNEFCSGNPVKNEKKALTYLKFVREVFFSDEILKMLPKNFSFIGLHVLDLFIFEKEEKGEIPKILKELQKAITDKTENKTGNSDTKESNHYNIDKMIKKIDEQLLNEINGGQYNLTFLSEYNLKELRELYVKIFTNMSPKLLDRIFTRTKEKTSKDDTLTKKNPFKLKCELLKGIKLKEDDLEKILNEQDEQDISKDRYQYYLKVPEKDMDIEKIKIAYCKCVLTYCSYSPVVLFNEGQTKVDEEDKEKNDDESGKYVVKMQNPIELSDIQFKQYIYEHIGSFDTYKTIFDFFVANGFDLGLLYTRSEDETNEGETREDLVYY